MGCRRRWPCFAAFLLVAYLALFPAAFAVRPRAGWSGPSGLRAILLAPPVWVASELGRQYVWDGFPWALLGYSQVTVLPIAQLASVVGVYGLSALLALTSAAVAYGLIAGGRGRWLPVLTTALLVSFVAGWGQARLQRNELLSTGDPVRVAVLQGNIAQGDKWNPALRDAITDRYLSMTRQALDQRGDVRHVAGIVDAVLFRARSDPRRSDSPARGREQSDAA